MRKEYGKALRKCFSEQMRKSLPAFEEMKIESQHLFPGQRAYRWHPGGNLHCWIVLDPDDRRDEFTVMIGWSKLGRYPELNVIPSPPRPSVERGEYQCEEYLTRLPFLVEGKDTWWCIYRPPTPTTVDEAVDEINRYLKPISSTEAQSAVAPHVHDSIKKLVQYGLPYLGELWESMQANQAL